MTAALTHTLAFVLMATSIVLAGDLALPERLRQVCPWARVATAFALGVAAVAVAFTLALVSGALSVPLIWGVQGLVTIAAAVRVVTLVKTGSLRLHRVGRAWAELSWVSRVCLVAAVAIAAATFIATLAPPSSMDATVYHLRMPAVDLAQGRWVVLSDIVQSFQPAYVEMAFGHAMALESDVAGALVHWALGIAAAISAGAWARRLGANPWVAALLVLGTPLFVWESTGAFIDLGLTLFGSLAIYWASRGDVGRIGTVIAGVLAGLAAGSKLTGGALAALAGVAAFAMTWPQRRLATARLLTIGVIAFMVTLPWYLHNLATTGNPFYPVGNPLLGLPFRQLAHVDYGYGRSLLNLLCSPFDLVWRGTPFDQGWAVGPALLALVPLGTFMARRIRIARVLAGSIVAFWVFWFYSMPQTRMLLPIFPLGAALAAFAVDGALAGASRALRVAVVGVASLSTLVGLAVALAFAAIYIPVAFGLETRDAFLTRVSWHYPAYAAANALVPQGARIAVIGAKNLYYLRRDATFIEETLTTDDLRQAGFSHRLLIAPCDTPPPRVPLLWSGKYLVPTSRLVGRSGEFVCASIETL